MFHQYVANYKTLDVKKDMIVLNEGRNGKEVGRWRARQEDVWVGKGGKERWPLENIHSSAGDISPAKSSFVSTLLEPVPL